jgi:hypothetical protein
MMIRLRHRQTRLRHQEEIGRRRRGLRPLDRRAFREWSQRSDEYMLFAEFRRRICRHPDATQQLFSSCLSSGSGEFLLIAEQCQSTKYAVTIEKMRTVRFWRASHVDHVRVLRRCAVAPGDSWIRSERGRMFFLRNAERSRWD